MQIIVPFLDSLALFQGIIIGFIIILLGKKQYAPLFFGLFLITYAIELGPGILMDFNIISDHSIIDFLPFRFYFLNIPLLFLYTEAIVGRFKWKTHVFWLLPGIFEFAFFATASIFYTHIGSDVREAILLLRGYAIVIWYIIIPIFILLRVRSYQKELDMTHTNPVTSNLRWVMYICIFFILISAPLFMETVLGKTSWNVYAVLSVINVIFMYVIGMLGLRQQYLELEDNQDGEQRISLDIQYIEEMEQKSSNDKLSLPTSTTAHLELPLVPETPDGTSNQNMHDQQYFKRIDEKVNTKELFLDSELTLFKVSREVGIQSRKMSEIIYKETGLYFKTYINGKRLEFAKAMLLNPKYQQYTMEAIAYDSGFHTKSTFFNLFKTIDGLTPAQYRDLHLERLQGS